MVENCHLKVIMFCTSLLFSIWRFNYYISRRNNILASFQASLNILIKQLNYLLQVYLGIKKILRKLRLLKCMSNIAVRKGCVDPITRLNPAICFMSVPNQDLDFQCQILVVFLMFNDFRTEIIVRFF